VTAVGRAGPDRTAPAPRPKPQTGPILHEARWDGRLARARAHVAVVVVYQRGDHQVIWPHERSRVLLSHRPATVYEVDLGLHHASVTAELPSRGYSASFQATFSVHWRVLNPSAIVRHQVFDMEETLSAELLHRARTIAREFSVDQITAAEDTINDQLLGVEIDITTPAAIQQALQKATKLGCLGAKYGLWTSAISHLTLDEATIQHNTRMMKLNWAIEEEQAEQKLRAIKNKNQQEIMEDRITVYREIIAAGDVEQFALRLASHPDEISAVTAIMRDDQLTRRRDTIDFISHMVDSGVVERWEVSDQVREALEWLRDATARVVTDKEHRTTQADQHVHQHRRGRGEPSSNVIVVAAETIEPDTDRDSSSKADGTEPESAP
jgi:hypothetical protein